MGSTDRNGRLVIGRRNAVQRMLDLEKKSKVNRLPASSLMPLRSSTSTARGQARDAISTFDHYPPTLESTGRAMTTPANSAANVALRKYIIRPGGEVVLQNEGDSDQETDASSICHSPGWDDISGKKRKKEKREAKERKKREKEKSEASTRHDPRLKNRLSKPPPNANSRFVNRLSIAVDRSVSGPAVPTLQSSAEANAKPKQAEEGRRSRRNSFDLGVKALASIIPWKTSIATPHTPIPAPIDGPITSSEKPPSRGSFSHHSRVSTDNNGFIGGLKLRQAEEANVQETVRQIKVLGHEIPVVQNENEREGGRDPQPKEEGTLSSDGSFVESIRPTSIYEDSVRSPHHWDEIFSNAAKMASKNSLPDGEPDVPIMERNIKKARKSYPPTSRYFPLDTDDSNTTRDVSIASTRTSTLSSPDSIEIPVNRRETAIQRPRQSSNVSMDRHPITTQRRSYGEPEAEILRGRQPTDYVRHGQQSRDQSMSGFRNENEVSEPHTTRKESRGRRMSFGRSKNRDATTSREAPTLRLPTREAEISQEYDIMESTRVEARVTPQNQFAKSQFEEKGSNHHRKTSSVIGLKGFRAAAKNAFTRHSVAVDSPPTTGSSSSYSDSLLPTSQRPKSSSRALNDSVLSTAASTASKAERVLGEVVPQSLVKDFGQRPYSSGRPLDSPDSIRAQHTIPNGVVYSGTNGRTFHTRTATDSSEEYSTLDEFSNVTTPTASRPNSQKNYKPSSEEPSPEMPQLEVTLSNLKKLEASSKKLDALDSPPVMSGGLGFSDAASARDSWCRTAKEIVLFDQDEEHRLKTPTGKKEPVTNFSAPFRDRSPSKIPAQYRGGSPPKMPSQSRRKSPELDHPSLPRSISTPDMQDLSFLPTLKHQALTRPEKGKHPLSKGKGPAAEQKSLVRPSATPATNTDIKSSDSHLPSQQHLQNARLNIPRPGPRSSSSQFPPSKPSNPEQNGPDPIAKMFVVCCSCKYFHDMPSKIYECMAKPDNVVTDPNLGVSGIISTSVKCPWCGHGMSTACCEGYAAVVYLRERLH